MGLRLRILSGYVDFVEEAWRGATGLIRSVLAPRFRLLFESLQTVDGVRGGCPCEIWSSDAPS